tara:strand:+ start:3538 stop:3891 length:354 start_codon:yes stop_codon:yes gene_type:complete
MSVTEYLQIEITNNIARWGDQKASSNTIRYLNILVQQALKRTGGLGVDRSSRLLFVGITVGRPVESTKELTQAEASALIEWLKDPDTGRLQEAKEVLKDIWAIERKCLLSLGQIPLC